MGVFRPIYLPTSGLPTQLATTDTLDAAAQLRATAPTGGTSGELIIDGRDNAGNTQFGVRVVDAADSSLYVGDVAGQNHVAGTPRHNFVFSLGGGGALTTGDKNVFIGTEAGEDCTTGGANVAVGYRAGANIVGATDCVCLGEEAGHGIVNNDFNFALGAEALYSLATGTNNIAIGVDAARALNHLNARWNVCIGNLAMFNITNTQQSVAIGYQALQDTDAGQVSNIAIGFQAATNATKQYNVSIGTQTGPAGTGSNCVYVGHLAGNGATNNANVCVGDNAGRSLTSGAGGTQMVLIGNNSGYHGSQTNGTNSIAIGYATFTDGDNQCILGNSSIVETVLRGSTAVRILASTNAQTLEVYNTYTSSTNFERGNFEWASNELRIGTEKGGTGGSARGLALQTDAVTRMSIGAGGDITIADGENIIVNTSTGSQLGTAADQKIGKWGATPVVQPSGANQAALTDSTGGTAGFTVSAVSGTGDDAGINDALASIIRLLNQIRGDLVTTGEIKGSA